MIGDSWVAGRIKVNGLTVMGLERCCYLGPWAIWSSGADDPDLNDELVQMEAKKKKSKLFIMRCIELCKCLDVL